MGRRLLAVAANSFAMIVHNRAVYLVVGAALLVIALMAAPLALARRAAEAGETDFALTIQQGIVLSSFAVWSFFAYGLAIFLGATTISSEVKAGTLTTVLARPLARWELLMGKWLGAQAFVTLFLGFGLVAVALLLRYFHVQPAPVFWIGVAGTFVTAGLLIGATLLLNVFVSPVVAGGAIFLAALLGGMAGDATSAARPWSAALAWFAHMALPARMPDDLVSLGFSSQPLAPEYGIYALVLAENVLYIGALLLVAGWLFTRLELKLR